MEDGVTPSGQMTFDLKTMSLGSQHGGSTQERPPVPLFAATGAHLSQPEVALSQQDFLGTPDFITPVDQFQLEYDPANKDARHQRSPARLSPNRNKRARKAGEGASRRLACSQVALPLPAINAWIVLSCRHLPLLADLVGTAVPCRRPIHGLQPGAGAMQPGRRWRQRGTVGQQAHRGWQPIRTAGPPRDGAAPLTSLLPQRL